MSALPTSSASDLQNNSAKPVVHVVGAGLAGSECAWQLAEMGYDVVLIEMRSGTQTPAHKTSDFAELVCSNSFGSINSAAAPGQLKWEAEHLGSKIMEAALHARVPAGQALGMDREVFAGKMTADLRAHPRIRIENKPVRSLTEVPRPCVIATGPLTYDPLAHDIQSHFGNQFLYFFDAIAPIISADSVNMDIAWRADRWDRGTKDYINCPMTKGQYAYFIQAIKDARKIEPKEFEKETKYFEGCMPIEAMIARGDKTARFGPMSAKGLFNPHTQGQPYAVVQLRQENKEATSYNMVGFQTKMAYGDQKEVFRMIPGLENAEFLKLGSIHRNLYIKTPKCLNEDLSSRHDPLLFFAGQMTGVEGYFESACIGLLVARMLDQKLRGVPRDLPPRETALGSLHAAITDETKDHFQPTNINFGLLPPIEDRLDKSLKRNRQIDNARNAFVTWMAHTGRKMKVGSRLEQASRELAEIVAVADAALEAQAQVRKAQAKMPFREVASAAQSIDT